MPGSVKANERNGEPGPQLLFGTEPSCSSWVTTRMRFPLPRRINSARRMPTSMLFPSPTASAQRIRWRICPSAWMAGSSWYGMSVDGGAVADPNLGVSRGRLAEEALQIEAGMADLGGHVRYEFGVLGVELLDVVDLGQAAGFSSPDELGNPGK